jgi:hypothetical protein
MGSLAVGTTGCRGPWGRPDPRSKVGLILIPGLYIYSEKGEERSARREAGAAICHDLILTRRHCGLSPQCVAGRARAAHGVPGLRYNNAHNAHVRTSTIIHHPFAQPTMHSHPPRGAEEK